MAAGAHAGADVEASAGSAVASSAASTVAATVSLAAGAYAGAHAGAGGTATTTAACGATGILAATGTSPLSVCRCSPSNGGVHSCSVAHHPPAVSKGGVAPCSSTSVAEGGCPSFAVTISFPRCCGDPCFPRCSSFSCSPLGQQISHTAPRSFFRGGRRRPPSPSPCRPRQLRFPLFCSDAEEGRSREGVMDTPNLGEKASGGPASSR